MKPRMDAAVPMDAKTRPQGLGKPPRTRFPTAPTRIIVSAEGKQKSASHTKILTLPHFEQEIRRPGDQEVNREIS
jgi:hypothetical protein